MGKIKRALVSWAKGMEFHATTGSGHRLTMDSAGQKGTASKGASPMDLLLVGMAGCTGMDVIDILRKKRQQVSGLEIQIEGTRSETFPKVYTHIRVNYVVRGKDVSAKAVEHAIHLSETKYCSASIMLGKTAKIKTGYEIVNA